MKDKEFEILSNQNIVIWIQTNKYASYGISLIRNNLQREKPEIKEPIIIKNFLDIIFLSLIQPTNGSVNMSIIFAKNKGIDQLYLLQNLNFQYKVREEISSPEM